MDKQLMIELFGYLGSFIVLVSFLMTSVLKLRIVNSVGSVIFMIYALIIHSYPTAIMNFCLVLINLHFLWKMRHGSKEYDFLEVEPSDEYLNYLLGRQSAHLSVRLRHIPDSRILLKWAVACNTAIWYNITV